MNNLTEENVEKIVEQIKQTKWHYLVNRKEALLICSMTDNGYSYFQENTGIPLQFTKILRLGNGDVLNNEKELDELRLFFINGGIDRLLNFKNRLISFVSTFDEVAGKIEKTNCKKLTKKELIGLLLEFLRAGMNAQNFLAPMPVADCSLSKMILDSLPESSEKPNWIRVLTYPEKENSHTLEERDFYKLTKMYKEKNSNFEKSLEEHVVKYCWIGGRLYHFENAWTKRDVLKRLQNFEEQGKNADEVLKHLDEIRENAKKKTEKLFKQLKIEKNSKLRDLISLAKEFAYLRTWRTDVIYRAGYKARNLFYEIAERAVLDKQLVIYLTCDEIVKLAEDGKSPVSLEELKKRKESCTTVTIDSKYLVYSGKKWTEKFRKAAGNYLGGEAGEPVSAVVKGNVAFRGKVTGKVKIVLDVNDIDKVEKGNVLVAVMTFPHFIAAMEKACAFVTDEGGILCHAAIVSREMRKPCIIGTKFATKVFKDGDFV